MTLEERCALRIPLNGMRYAIYWGKEHDLYIALPEYEKLQSNFKIVFDKEGKEPPVIYFHDKRYEVSEAPLRTEDRGYYCIQGKFKGSKGLHKIPLHRLAYTAFYGQPPVGYHIHHIDKNKHNNAADNLVALTEEEHSAVHGRDVSVPKNLFTKTQKNDLFTRARIITKSLDISGKINDALLATPTIENIEKAVRLVLTVADDKKASVLACLCDFWQRTYQPPQVEELSPMERLKAKVAEAKAKYEAEGEQLTFISSDDVDDEYFG